MFCATMLNIILLFGSVIAMHSNWCISMHPKSNLRALLAAFVPSTVSTEDAPKVFPLSNYYSFLVEETGYLHIQATKPDTVGKNHNCIVERILR